jgi:antitoxin component YwqK of YwqJK toxin-antitoxin module
MVRKNGQLGKIAMYIDEIKSQVPLNNGIKHGEQKMYREDGQLWKTTMYTNGKKNGESKLYHENGALKESRMYIDGKTQGEFKRYHPNGKLMEQGMYNNDINHCDY